MLNGEGFDRWADRYDEEVRASETENAYPFAGYGKVLGSIFRIISEKKNASVLDIGFGTGTLTSRLYENGCTVFGQDFSKRMVELASGKMPGAHLYFGDFTKGLVEPLCDMKYDFIVATYSLHHLTDGQKTVLLETLQERLNDGGQILIGDIAFGTRRELERCRMETGEAWDDEEIYCVADELKRTFPALSFTKISFCSGVLSLPADRQNARC